ncbi:hypothetical protein LSAT2_012571 [Lamellibrachia satsuma]|nr:hypothetical protein LSAT2_012571 [Lamellibrachia satsuma]
MDATTAGDSDTDAERRNRCVCSFGQQLAYSSRPFSSAVHLCPDRPGTDWSVRRDNPVIETGTFDSHNRTQSSSVSLHSSASLRCQLIMVGYLATLQGSKRVLSSGAPTSQRGFSRDQRLVDVFLPTPEHLRSICMFQSSKLVFVTICQLWSGLRGDLKASDYPRDITSFYTSLRALKEVKIDGRVNWVNTPGPSRVELFLDTVLLGTTAFISFTVVSADHGRIHGHREASASSAAGHRQTNEARAYSATLKCLIIPCFLHPPACPQGELIVGSQYVVQQQWKFKSTADSTGSTRPAQAG